MQTASLRVPGSRTNPELIAARFLLKPDRKYEDAVRTFQPYNKIKEVNHEARQAGAAMIPLPARYDSLSRINDAQPSS